MPRRILEVFLSSTALDLEQHRAAIHAELISTGLFHCIRQEDFGSQNAGAVEFCRKKVNASDVFVGLAGQRRGWEPDGDNAKRSITEMEHDWAREAGRRRFLYVAPDNFPVPGNLRDTDEQHERQQAFRKRVMDGGERIVSQKGFENPERFAADLVKHLLTQLVTGDLITLLRPELSPQSSVSPDDQRPAIAAAVERLAQDEDVDLLALAKNPKNVDLADLELKLRDRAERHEAEGQSSLKAGAEYWRHIGALAFLHNTKNAFAAYEKAVALDPSEPEAWRYLGELQYRLGNLAGAEQSFGRVISLGASANDIKTQATGCLRLGWILRDRGNFTEAETLIAKAARLAESVDWKEGLGRAYANLGIIHQTRGDLDEAEQMLRKALVIEEALASNAGMARAYGNLGIIYQARGDLAKAEDMHLRSLKIETERGNKEGMAADYVNLGVIREAQGETDKAEDMLLKGLTLYEEVGGKEGMALTHGNLGNIHETRGDLDKAEEAYRRGLTLFEELGKKDSMALEYRNIGVIYQRKGDKAAMRECWCKARDLYRDMGLPNEVAELDEWLRDSENSSGQGVESPDAK